MKRRSSPIAIVLLVLMWLTLMVFLGNDVVNGISRFNHGIDGILGKDRQ